MPSVSNKGLSVLFLLNISDEGPNMSSPVPNISSLILLSLGVSFIKIELSVVNRESVSTVLVGPEKIALNSLEASVVCSSVFFYSNNMFSFFFFWCII